VGQGKLYDNAVSGDSRTASLSGGRIFSFQGEVLQQSVNLPSLMDLAFYQSSIHRLESELKLALI